MAGESGSETAASDANGTPQGENSPGRLRELYEAEKARNDQLAATVARIERDNAFKEAGLPAQAPGLGLFRQHYSGELTPEAIRAAAEAEGFLSPAQATPDSDREIFDRLHDDRSEPGPRPDEPRVSGKHIEELNKLTDNDDVERYLRANGIMPRVDD
jgi:hypothetical protein